MIGNKYQKSPSYLYKPESMTIEKLVQKNEDYSNVLLPRRMKKNSNVDVGDLFKFSKNTTEHAYTRELEQLLSKQKNSQSQILNHFADVVKENRILKSKLFKKFDYNEMKEFYKQTKRKKKDRILKFNITAKIHVNSIKKSFNDYEIDLFTSSIFTRDQYLNLRKVFDKIESIRISSSHNCIEVDGSEQLERSFSVNEKIIRNNRSNLDENIILPRSRSEYSKKDDLLSSPRLNIMNLKGGSDNNPNYTHLEEKKFMKNVVKKKKNHLFDKLMILKKSDSMNVLPALGKDVSTRRFLTPPVLRRIARDTPPSPLNRVSSRTTLVRRFLKTGTKRKKRKSNKFTNLNTSTSSSTIVFNK